MLRSRHVLPSDLPAHWQGQPLWAYLAQRFAHVPAPVWQQRLAQQQLWDAQGQPLPANALCQPSLQLFYAREVAAEAPLPVQEQVLYEDAHVLVVDKPHFLPVQPSGQALRETLLWRLRQRPGCEAIVPAHRLDRDTAGLVLWVKRPQDRAAYQNLFRDRQVAKLYWAVAAAPDVTQPAWFDFAADARQASAWQAATPTERQAQLQGAGVWLRAQMQRSAQHFMQAECQPAVAGQGNALTHLQCVADLGQGRSAYALRPVTGRRHQLRAQMAALGLPLLGDGIYPVLTPEQAQPHLQPPLQLLAKALAFSDPLTGQARQFVSALALQDWPQALVGPVDATAPPMPE